MDLVREVIEHGEERKDRTGTGTLSLFGRMCRYNLKDGIMPLMTTKRVYWKGVAEELLWFIRGCTDAKELSKKGVKIWDANGSREELDKRGLVHREEGDLGPVYGFQWRHFGAKYQSCHTDYTGQGVDQLQRVMKQLCEEPESRRIIMSAWNPVDEPDMALPPCHAFVQFYVTSKKELNCMMTQRSADLGLGVPFNVASYALLTHLLAAACNLTPGQLVHSIGDAHVYKDHVSPLLQQLTREPRPFPILKLNKAITSLDDVTFDDLEIIGYESHAPIQMKMAV